MQSETVFYVVTLDKQNEFRDFLTDAYGCVVPFDKHEALQMHHDLEYGSGIPAAIID